MPTIDRKDLNKGLLALLLIIFFTTTFKERLGNVYLGILMFILIIPLTYPSKFGFNVISKNTIKSILFAVIAYIALFAIHVSSSFFLSAVNPTFQGMVDLLRQQAVLALEGSKFLEMLSIIIVIPYIETTAIARAIDFSTHVFKVGTEKITLALLALFIIVSVGFTLLHIQVRGVDNVGYFITFVFGMLQCYLIYKLKESESATWMHIFNNGVAYFR